MGKEVDPSILSFDDDDKEAKGSTHGLTLKDVLTSEGERSVLRVCSGVLDSAAVATYLALNATTNLSKEDAAKLDQTNSFIEKLYGDSLSSKASVAEEWIRSDAVPTLLGLRAESSRAPSGESKHA